MKDNQCVGKFCEMVQYSKFGHMDFLKQYYISKLCVCLKLEEFEMDQFCRIFQMKFQGIELQDCLFPKYVQLDPNNLDIQLSYAFYWQVVLSKCDYRGWAI